MNWVIKGCAKVVDMDDQESDLKKRFTPWIKLMEKIVLGFADRGKLQSFSNLGETKSTHQDSCLAFTTYLLRRDREELCDRLEKYCTVTPESISVYAHGRTPPNVFSILHLTVESLMRAYVCLSLGAIADFSRI